MRTVRIAENDDPAVARIGDIKLPVGVAGDVVRSVELGAGRAGAYRSKIQLAENLSCGLAVIRTRGESAVRRQS